MSITIRHATLEDSPLLQKWLMDPDVLRWFPMMNEKEIEDSVRIWMSYTRFNAGIAAEIDGVPCGLANLYIQPFKKFSHQCLFSIIVGEGFRGKGVGTALLKHLMKMAKEQFHIEILHLEVYDGNPAIHLYQRMGFKEYGRHPRFIKEENGTYVDKIFMQKEL